MQCTLPTDGILSCKNARVFLVCGFLMKSFKKNIENMKKIVGASKQLCIRIFFFCFCFNTSIFVYLFEYKTIETHAHTFLPLNISDVGSVSANGYKLLLAMNEWLELGSQVIKQCILRELAQWNTHFSYSNCFFIILFF